MTNDVSIRLTDRQLERVERSAERHHRSVEDTVLRALDLYLHIDEEEGAQLARKADERTSDA